MLWGLHRRSYLEESSVQSLMYWPIVACLYISAKWTRWHLLLRVFSFEQMVFCSSSSTKACAASVLYTNTFKKNNNLNRLIAHPTAAIGKNEFDVTGICYCVSVFGSVPLLVFHVYCQKIIRFGILFITIQGFLWTKNLPASIVSYVYVHLFTVRFSMRIVYLNSFYLFFTQKN